MKFLMLAALLCSSSLVSLNLFAQENVNEVLEQRETKEVKKERKRRRPKMQMCHECGKPEVDCECEGEGHGIKEDHNHDQV